MPFNDNVFFEFLTGTGDKTVTEGTDALIAKFKKKSQKTHRFTFDAMASPTAMLNNSIPNLLLVKIKRTWLEMKKTAMCRIFLMGHGDWKNHKIGDWSAHHVASLCNEARVPADIAHINVLGCRLGRDEQFSIDGLVAHSMNSFGSHFHYLLGAIHGVRTRVFARVYSVAINPETKKDIMGRTIPQGATGTVKNDSVTRAHVIFHEVEEFLYEEETALHRRLQSKYVFYWEGNSQKRKWAY